MVFRALHGRAWVGASGRDTVGIEGSALFVWLPTSPIKEICPLSTRLPVRPPTWGVEAVMLSAGTNVEWLRDDLGLIPDEAASADELTERIGELWPELGEIRVAEVQAAVDSLVDAQLIEAVEQAVAPAGLT